VRFAVCIILLTRFCPELREVGVSINVTLTEEETCSVSQYGVGDGYHGRWAASGEWFNPYTLTAAHHTRRFESQVTVTSKVNGRSVRVRIMDRGPFVKGRCIDLSRAAANAIGLGDIARVTVSSPRRPRARLGDPVLFVSENLPAVERWPGFL
jgi:rare lipoprotein A (peptidoglycan hydrolase)